MAEAWRRARRRRFAAIALLVASAALGVSLYFFVGGGGSVGAGGTAKNSAGSRATPARTRFAHGNPRAPDLISKTPPDKYVTNRIDRWPAAFVGKSPKQIVNALASRVSGSLIVSAWVGNPPRNYHPISRSKPLPPNIKSAIGIGKMAQFTVRAPCECGRADRGLWQAELVAGALRDALRANGFYLIGQGTRLQVQGGKGGSTSGGCCGNIVYDQQFPTPPAREIASKIRAAAKGTGLRIQSVQIERVDQPAPMVVATTRTPKAIVERSGSLGAVLFGRTPSYEGYYLEVRTPHGPPFLILSTSLRSGVGTTWASRKFMCLVGDAYTCGRSIHRGPVRVPLSKLRRDPQGQQALYLWRKNNRPLLEVTSGPTRLSGPRARVHIRGHVARLTVKLRPARVDRGKIKVEAFSYATTRRIWFEGRPPSVPGGTGRSRSVLLGRAPYEGELSPIFPRSGEYQLIALKNGHEVGGVVVRVLRTR